MGNRCCICIQASSVCSTNVEENERIDYRAEMFKKIFVETTKLGQDLHGEQFELRQL